MSPTSWTSPTPPTHVDMADSHVWPIQNIYINPQNPITTAALALPGDDDYEKPHDRGARGWLRIYHKVLSATDTETQCVFCGARCFTLNGVSKGSPTLTRTANWLSSNESAVVGKSAVWSSVNSITWTAYRRGDRGAQLA